eukprot:gene20723-16021_t
MGSAQSNPRDHCATAFANVYTCKKEHGLSPNACYPATYRGQCDFVEGELKKCLSFAVDKRAAEIYFDTSNPRAERVAANKILQKKLQRFIPQCTPEV